MTAFGVPAPWRRGGEGFTLSGHAEEATDSRARPARGGADRRRRRGRRGARTCASASGARCARTTAPAATPGTTSRTTRRARAPTAGARTGSPGICDERQRLCLALALWNGADPILKERMFGLTNSEGNHGEDVKEYWFYLDSTPTHSYMKCQYKYPQRAFPYERPGRHERPPRQAGDRVRAARHRHLRRGPLLRRRRRVRQGRARRHPDAGHRAQPRAGRGDAAPAADAVVPQHVVVGRRRRPKPSLERPTATRRVQLARRARRVAAAAPTRPSCCSARTRRTTSGCSARQRLADVKDGINDYVVGGDADAVNPSAPARRCAAHHVLEIARGRQRRASACG